MERQARATGLEPATTGSTVQYSNQLSYAPVCWSINISITHDHPERSMGGPSSKRPCKPNFTLADPNRMAVQIGADTHGRPNRGTPRCGPSSVRLGRIGQEVARQPQHWTFQKQPGSRRSPGLRPRLFTIFAKIFRGHFGKMLCLSRECCVKVTGLPKDTRLSIGRSGFGRGTRRVPRGGRSRSESVFGSFLNWPSWPKGEVL